MVSGDSAMLSVGVLDDWHRVAERSADWSKLTGEAVIEFYHDHLTDEGALMERLRSHDVLVVMRERTPLPRNRIEALPDLRLIVTAGDRNLAIDLDACRDQGIAVCHTQIGYKATVELTWALILALTKQIIRADASIRNGGWGDHVSSVLEERTLGILGMGKLGKGVARVGLLFGMNVIAWSHNLTPDAAAEHGVEAVSLDSLLTQSDVASIHLVLSDRTRSLIGRAELSMMKASAYLINTSRGPIVEEAALIEALSNGTIAGAGLDVFDEEPLPADHPFRKLPNTVLTPHLGGFVDENYQIWYSDAVEDIEAWVTGDPIRVLA